MLFFVGQILPYIAGGIFLVGMAYRIMCWLKIPVPFQLTLFPAPQGGGERIVFLSSEFFFSRASTETTKVFGYGHGCCMCLWLVVIVGHVVGIITL